MTSSELPQIKDKMDVDSATEIVVIGWPANESALEELLFWSCFPNDLVCWVSYPYVTSLRDELLAPAMAQFIEHCLARGHTNMIASASAAFIAVRGAGFPERIAMHLQGDAAKWWLSVNKSAGERGTSPH